MLSRYSCDNWNYGYYLCRYKMIVILALSLIAVLVMVCLFVRAIRQPIVYYGKQQKPKDQQ